MPFITNIAKNQNFLNIKKERILFYNNNISNITRKEILISYLISVGEAGKMSSYICQSLQNLFCDNEMLATVFFRQYNLDMSKRSGRLLEEQTEELAVDLDRSGRVLGMSAFIDMLEPASNMKPMIASLNLFNRLKMQYSTKKALIIKMKRAAAAVNLKFFFDRTYLLKYSNAILRPNEIYYLYQNDNIAEASEERRLKRNTDFLSLKAGLGTQIRNYKQFKKELDIELVHGSVIRELSYGAIYSNIL